MRRTKQPKEKTSNNSPRQSRRSRKPVKKEGVFNSGMFQPGNEIWKRVKNPGKSRKYLTPEDLWKACKEYFEYIEANPFREHRLAGMYYGEAVKTHLNKRRPMTVAGLCLYLDIAHVTWLDYKKRDPGYTKVCTYAEAVIRDQKFAGAAAGFFNPAIIARDLGLVDRTDVQSGDEPLRGQTVVILPAKEKLPE